MYPGLQQVPTCNAKYRCYVLLVDQTQIASYYSAKPCENMLLCKKNGYGPYEYLFVGNETNTSCPVQETMLRSFNEQKVTIKRFDGLVVGLVILFLAVSSVVIFFALRSLGRSKTQDKDSFQDSASSVFVSMAGKNKVRFAPSVMNSERYLSGPSSPRIITDPDAVKRLH